MTIIANCSCGETHLVLDEYAGRSLLCGKCGRQFAVPSGSQGQTGEETVVFQGNTGEIREIRSTKHSTDFETSPGNNQGETLKGFEKAASAPTPPGKSDEAPTEIDRPSPGYPAYDTALDSSFELADPDMETTRLLPPRPQPDPTLADAQGMGNAPTIRISLGAELPGKGGGSHESIKSNEIDLSRRITPSVTPMEGLPEISNDAQYGVNRIIRPHAKGGMGLIQIAYDQFLKREVALKELRPEVIGDESIVQRFIGEAEITAQLEHPGIVPIHNLGLDNVGNPYYTMKLIKGVTFQDAIKAYHLNPTPGELMRLVRRLVSVCQTMSFAHDNGVIHRDLKPANIMLSEHGETIVMDWGLAKAYQTAGYKMESNSHMEGHSSDSIDLTIVGAVVGTPAFMSPEQASPEARNVGPASDVYGLGAILYVLLTGKPAFAARSTQDVLERVRKGEFVRPSTIKKNVPPGLEAICMKAMARELKNRYQNARELITDLCNWLDGEPVAAMQLTFGENILFWLQKRKQLALKLLLIFASVCFLSIGVVAFYLSTHDRLERTADAAILEKSLDLTKQPAVRHRLGETSDQVRLSQDGVVKSGSGPSLLLEFSGDGRACLEFQSPPRIEPWNLSNHDTLHLALHEQALIGREGIESFFLRLGSGSRYFEYRIDPELWRQRPKGEWFTLNIPLAGSARFVRTESNTPSLHQIDWLELHFTAKALTTINVDDVKFTNQQNEPLELQNGEPDKE